MSAAVIAMPGATRLQPRPKPADQAQLRRWLEYVVETGIEMLDALDAAELELEDDELGNDDSVEALRA